MPFGGQMPAGEGGALADRIAGEELELKKAQNQATKNITSEAMNRIMP